MTAFFLTHWPYVLAALGAVVVGVKAWLSRWRLQRALSEASAQRDHAVVTAAIAVGKAQVAEAKADLAIERVELDAEAAKLLKEIDHAVEDLPSAATPADRIAAVDRVSREIEARERARAGRTPTATLPRRR